MITHAAAYFVIEWIECATPCCQGGLCRLGGRIDNARSQGRCCHKGMKTVKNLMTSYMIKFEIFA